MEIGRGVTCLFVGWIMYKVGHQQGRLQGRYEMEQEWTITCVLDPRHPLTQKQLDLMSRQYQGNERALAEQRKRIEQKTGYVIPDKLTDDDRRVIDGQLQKLGLGKLGWRRAIAGDRPRTGCHARLLGRAYGRRCWKGVQQVLAEVAGLIPSK